MAVHVCCEIPSFIHVDGFGQNDHGDWMIAYSVGEEETEVDYLDEFCERVKFASELSKTLMDVVNGIKDRDVLKDIADALK